jgi:hypothetical protein
VGDSFAANPLFEAVKAVRASTNSVGAVVAHPPDKPTMPKATAPANVKVANRFVLALFIVKSLIEMGDRN